MQIRTRHVRAARVLWECGGNIDEATTRCKLRRFSIRRWLKDQKFKDLVTQESGDQMFQTAAAAVRWAPAAVARLIRDLDGDSPADARVAARDILKLAVEANAKFRGDPDPKDAAPPVQVTPANDPLSRRVTLLTDDQLKKMLEILNGSN